MAMIQGCCPVCLSKDKAHLEATGGEWVGLLIPGYGSVRPCVCLNCGTVYVPKDVLDRLNRRTKDGN